MNLEKFVAEVLDQVVGGVKEAQAKVPDGGIIGGDSVLTRVEVEFEVPLDWHYAAGDVPVMNVSMRANVARVQFKVPVYLPVQAAKS